MAEPSTTPPRRRMSRAQLALSLSLLPVFGAWLVVPFVAAGTLRWPAAWGYFVTMIVAAALHGRYVARRNPGLRERRRRIGEGTRSWDVAWNFGHWLLMVAIPVAAGLERARHAATMPPAAFAAGAAILAAGFALSARAMAVNPFFEGTVRIQKDVGHRVVDQGPYGVVRHPGYVGLAAWSLSGPFLLLSVWGLAVAAASVAWIVLRTALEDAFLRRELDGYADYARRVRYRLVPGIW